MDIISKIEENLLNFNNFMKQEEYLDKTIVYFTSDIPVEIISAFDLIPFRISPDINTGKQINNIDSIIQPFNCSKSRQMLEYIINNGSEIMGGIFSENYCDSLQNFLDVLSINNSLPSSFKSFRILLPVKRGGMNEMNYYYEELKRLVRWLEDWTGTKISSKKLHESIIQYNQKRKLLRTLADLANETGFKQVSISKFFKLKTGTDILPIDKSIKLLYNVIHSINTESNENVKSPIRQKLPRLLISGSMFENYKFFEQISVLDQAVIANDLSFGSRSTTFEINIIENKSENYDLDELLKQIAYAYIVERVPDSVNYPSKIRRDYLVEQISKNRIDGVIFIFYGFCDPDAFESRNLSHYLEQEHNIPTLILETDPQLTNISQLTTRVEAFIEKIG